VGHQLLLDLGVAGFRVMLEAAGVIIVAVQPPLQLAEFPPVGGNLGPEVGPSGLGRGFG
jgi:hypothetical protein